MNSRAATGALSAGGQRPGGKSAHALSQALVVKGAARNLEAVVPICPTGGSVDLRGRTLTATLYFDGPDFPAEGGEHMIAAYYETPNLNSLVGTLENPSVKNALSFRATFPAAANGVGKIGIYMYINGSSDWSGTVYIDDVVVE
jgi:hypothetical protein